MLLALMDLLQIYTKTLQKVLALLRNTHVNFANWHYITVSGSAFHTYSKSSLLFV